MTKESLTKDTPIVSMDLFIAQQCTMDCIYCYGGGGEYGEPGIMEDETAIRAVDWMWNQRGKAKILSINFFGGEPLLRFDLLKKTVSHARALEKSGDTRFHFCVATNGTLITEEIIRYLKANRFGVNVGFDGPEDIHDRNRPLRNGGASYQTVVPRVRRLIEAMPKDVTLRATLWHRGEVDRVIKALADFNPPRYQTQPASPGGHCGKNTQFPTADGEDTARAIREAALTFVEAIRAGDISTLDAISKWLNFKWLLSVFDPPGRRPPMCTLGRTMAAVSSSGDIYPCHRFVGWEETRIGNIFDGRLDRAMYLHATFPHNGHCNTCWARQACNGGCLFDHQMRTGDPFTPSDHYCQMICSILEIAIHMKHELTESEQAFLRKEKILSPRFCPLDLF